MEQGSSVERWEGKVSEKLRNSTKEQAWPLVKDFFNLHNRFPTLATCYGVHGSNGEPGCIRYCAGSSLPSSDGSGTVSWSKERLVAVDDVERSIKYEMVDGNIGFKSYESTMRVLSDDGGDGCIVEWSFAVDPVEGLVLEDLVNKYHVGLHLMAQKMEDEIASSVNGNPM